MNTNLEKIRTNGGGATGALEADRTSYWRQPGQGHTEENKGAQAVWEAKVLLQL